ncbi:MAG: VOC family protein [Ferruginibacter sp.]
MSNQSPQIIPMLSYENGITAMDWLCKVFGFSERARMVDNSGILTHGEITLGDGVVMLSSQTPDYQSPKHHRLGCEDTTRYYNVPYIINGLLVCVDDVENHYEKSRGNGAAILSDLEEGGPRLRYRAEDLEGHRWMFIQK